MNDRKKQVMSFVRKILMYWQTEPNPHLVRADLANLRRGIGKKPGELPQLWELLFRDFPEELMSQNGNPTWEEWAVCGALTLYAMHQQGNDQKMHMDGQRLGIAIGSLADGDEDHLKPVQRRFNAFATAKGMPECLHHLRGLIQLLRRDGIPLDYVELAGDLYVFQTPDGAARIRLQWGQDFYRTVYRRQERKDDNHE